jgi:hypothetical protein
MKKITNDPRRTHLTDGHVERNKIMKEAGAKMARLSKEQPRSAAEAHHSMIELRRRVRATARDG